MTFWITYSDCSIGNENLFSMFVWKCRKNFINFWWELRKTRRKRKTLWFITSKMHLFTSECVFILKLIAQLMGFSMNTASVWMNRCFQSNAYDRDNKNLFIFILKSNKATLFHRAKHIYIHHNQHLVEIFGEFVWITDIAYMRFWLCCCSFHDQVHRWMHIW